MIGENKPFAHQEYFLPEDRFELIVVGPRRRRFPKDTEIFGCRIEKDYEIDGASVPRPFWFILSPFTEGLRAAAVHDKRHYPGMTWRARKHADDEFYRNLGRCGLNRLRCFLSWFGVRTWAWLTFWRWSK